MEGVREAFLIEEWWIIIVEGRWIKNYILLLVSCSLLSESLRPHGLQPSRLPCPSLSPRICSNSCPSSWWCHPAISRCPLFLLPSVFPSIQVFSSESALLIRWPKNWSFSMSPSNKNSELISFRMDWLDVLASPRDSRVFSNTTIQKHQILQHSSFFMVQLSHPHMTTR